MNERLLNALMQLFAAVAREGGLNASEIEVVRRYLEQQLSPEHAKPFLLRFQAYALALDPPDLDQVCATLNQDLGVQQKYFILIRLLELIQADAFISESEHAAYFRIAQAFKVPDTDYQPLYDFITTSRPRQLFHANLLIVSSSKGSVRGKHRLEPNLVGYLAIMHLPGAELYLMRYMGNGEAYLSGQA
ncbi:MAG: TerB family tellurite resistance protein, partial [Bacteroidia bacterium]|nr:TerB family tellurite resistance protein [Bacteroidia bacterium]